MFIFKHFKNVDIKKKPNKDLKLFKHMIKLYGKIYT